MILILILNLNSGHSWNTELPGRTMEFTFDLSQTPVIERRHRYVYSYHLAVIYLYKSYFSC